MADNSTLAQASSNYSEEKFQQALRKRRYRQPAPEFVTGNRGAPVRSMSEDKLSADAVRWFDEFEAKITFYEKLDVDLSWLLDWTKKYWWSWLERDMSIAEELYVPGVKYKDVSSFGRTMVGIDEFIKYNFAFFDAVPDLRYDPLPGQVYLDVTPAGEVRFAVRYVGSGHWDGPLRLYPYDETAPAIPGTGQFVQITAVDRYHFDSSGRMAEGETLFDILDAAQVSTLLPRDDTWQFHALMRAAAVGNAARKTIRRLGLG